MPYRALTDPFDSLYAMAGRTRQVARPLPKLIGADVRSSVVVRLKDHYFAVLLTEVSFFNPMPAISKLPGVKPWLLGVGSLRSNLVCVTDLWGFMTGEASSAGLHARLIVVQEQGNYYGLAVDELISLHRFPHDRFEQITERPNEALNRFIQGKVPHPTYGEVPVLDLLTIIHSHRFLDAVSDEAQSGGNA